MTLVAVTGASGRIGTPLVAALTAAGYAVRALTRRPRPAQPGVEWIAGDLTDPAALATLMRDVRLVIHAGGQLEGDAATIEASLVDGTAGLLQAACHARMVHVSSLVVVQTALATPDRIDEMSPLEPTPARRGVYTRAKVAAEALVRQAATTQDVVIVRPGVVVTDEVRIPPSIGWSRGNRVFLVGPADALLPTVHAADVASGLLIAATRLPPGEVLHLIDPAPMTRAALLRRVLRGEPAAVMVRSGSLALALARMAYASHLPTIADAGYRLLSAATPHHWSSERAVHLGWCPATQVAPPSHD